MSRTGRRWCEDIIREEEHGPEGLICMVKQYCNRDFDKLKGEKRMNKGFQELKIDHLVTKACLGSQTDI